MAVMASEHSGVTGVQRLAQQLQSLSELTESLTYRLLELEERVDASDRQLQPLLQGDGQARDALGEEAELRLDETEERLLRLESLLAGLESPSHAPAPIEKRRESARLQPDDGVVFLEESFSQSFLDEQEPLDEQDQFDEQDQLDAQDQLDSQDQLDEQEPLDAQDQLDDERLIA